MSVICCELCGEDMKFIESGNKIEASEELTFWISYCFCCGTVAIQYSNSTDIEWIYIKEI